MAEIDRYFRALLESEGSDLHLLEGEPPKIRQHGHITPIQGEGALGSDSLRAMLEEICPEERWQRFENSGDMDFAYALPNGRARFRANYYRQLNGLGAVFRTIPTRILTLEDLNAPELFKDLCNLQMGLVLVTGPTGSGKSTTLAGMLNHINESRALKILTIEDPIEFVHPNKRSFFIQREVGEHTDTFASGLRAAGREDCNVILVGEMRDLETISLAISAAEMGVLVFGTVHTNSAAKTIDRLANVFPPDQQPQVLSMLSTSLKAVISQQLLRRADGSGRVASFEIMITNAALSGAIRAGQIAKLNQLIQAGSREGMTTMDDSLMRYVEDGTVSAQAAFLKALDKNRFQRLVDREKQQKQAS